MKSYFKTLKNIYKNPSYIIVSLLSSVIFAGLLSYAQNLQAVNTTASYSTTILKKLYIVIKILSNFYTSNLTGSSLYLHLILILLISTQTTVLVYLYNQRKKFSNVTSVSLASLLGLLGSGCASCGGVIITSIATGVGGIYLSTFSEYYGNIFLLIAIFVAVLSILSILKKIQQPLVC